jgi:imidazolonepropionase-like amidohydrolase
VLVIGRAAWESNPRRETMKAPVDPGPGCNNVVAEPGLDPSAIVRSAKALGASALKLYGDLSEDAVRRLTGEAHREGLKVWAHAALLPARPSDLVRAGVDVLSHAPYLVWEAVAALPPYTEGALRSAPFARVPPSDPAIDRVLESMAKRRVVLDATLVLYALQSETSAAAREEFRPDRLTYAAAVKWGIAVTRRARQLGVAVSTGTDAMGGDVDGELPNIHRELELLVQEAGFTPLQAIAAATSVAARAVGIEKTVGTIVPGQQADLVILSGNPLVDIRHTRQIRGVIKKGKLLEGAH